MTASYRLRRKLGGQNCCLPPDRRDTTTRESVGDPSALQQFPIRWWSPDLPQPVRIPTESGHLFRLNPGTRSDESGHPWKEALA